MREATFAGWVFLAWLGFGYLGFLFCLWVMTVGERLFTRRGKR